MHGTKLILSRGDKYWHGSCGERFDGSEGWVAAADSPKRKVLMFTRSQGFWNRRLSHAGPFGGMKFSGGARITVGNIGGLIGAGIWRFVTTVEDET